MNMKIIFVMAALLVVQPILLAQNSNDTITENDVKRIIHFLASDSLKGRGNGRPELLKAGLFIGEEFKKNSLKPLLGNAGYFMPFRPFGGSKKIIADALVWNGKKLSTDEFIYIHPEPGNYIPKKLSDFTVIKIGSFFTENILESYKHIKTDLLLWSDQPQPDKENYFPPRFKLPLEGLEHNILMVCASYPPDSILLSGLTNYYSHVEYNIVGLIPGKSKPAEVILFSAHYDHEGVFQRKRKDSILNGANDNASGVAALLALVNYFSQRNDNDRTIIFCAFAGEELGLLGSKDFVNYINPESIIAGINIEMIGIPQYGKNNIFITGYDHSSLPLILEKQLSATPVHVKTGPAEEKELFNRSDNFPFVEKGIPAHTIMSSDDDDKCYHQPCDEIKRINIPHMTTIIKAIAVASRTLISGKDTPTRVSGRW